MSRDGHRVLLLLQHFLQQKSTPFGAVITCSYLLYLYHHYQSQPLIPHFSFIVAIFTISTITLHIMSTPHWCFFVCGSQIVLLCLITTIITIASVSSLTSSATASPSSPALVPPNIITVSGHSTTSIITFTFSIIVIIIKIFTLIINTDIDITAPAIIQSVSFPEAASL